MGYPTVAALVAASSGDARSALDAMDDAQQDALRVASIAAVEEFCGQAFVEDDTTELIDGRGGDYLALPRRLATLTTLAVTGTSLDASSVTLSRDHDALRLTSVSGNYYTRTLADLDPEPRAFREGRANVTIEGIWGWLDSEFPEAIGTAIRKDMEAQALADVNALGSSVVAYRALGLRDIRQGNLSVSMNGGQILAIAAQRYAAPFVWQPQPVTA